MKIRIGNDFKTKWAITWLGEPEDFSDATDISLFFNIYDKKIELTKDVDYTITDNIIEIDVTPDICNILGVYNLELHYTKPNDDFIDGERRSAVDKDAFRIVSKSEKADATQDVSIISDAVAIFLDIAYKKLEKIEANEDVRIASENEREDAEDIRVANEDIRISNEQDRQINTTTAISNAEQATLNANNSAVYANEQGAYAEEMSLHPPTIIDDYWHIWNFTTNQYETTGQYARGDSAVEGSLVVQTTGQSAVNTMSQKAVTDELVQLAGNMGVAFSIVKDPSAKFTDGELATLKAVKDIKIRGIDLSEDWAINVFVGPGGSTTQRIWITNRANENDSHSIILNNSEDVAWTHYVSGDVKIDVLVDWRGVASGNILNGSTNDRMILSKRCYLDDVTYVTEAQFDSLAEDIDLSINRTNNSVNFIYDNVLDITSSQAVVDSVDGLPVAKFGDSIAAWGFPIGVRKNVTSITFPRIASATKARIRIRTGDITGSVIYDETFNDITSGTFNLSEAVANNLGHQLWLEVWFNAGVGCNRVNPAQIYTEAKGYHRPRFSADVDAIDLENPVMTGGPAIWYDIQVFIDCLQETVKIKEEAQSESLAEDVDLLTNQINFIYDGVLDIQRTQGIVDTISGLSPQVYGSSILAWGFPIGIRKNITSIDMPRIGSATRARIRIRTGKNNDGPVIYDEIFEGITSPNFILSEAVANELGQELWLEVWFDAGVSINRVNPAQIYTEAKGYGPPKWSVEVGAIDLENPTMVGGVYFDIQAFVNCLQEAVKIKDEALPNFEAEGSTTSYISKNLRICCAGSSVTWGTGFLQDSMLDYLIPLLQKERTPFIGLDKLTLNSSAQQLLSANDRLFFDKKAIRIQGIDSSIKFEIESDEISIVQGIERTNQNASLIDVFIDGVLYDTFSNFNDEPIGHEIQAFTAVDDQKEFPLGKPFTYNHTLKLNGVVQTITLNKGSSMPSSGWAVARDIMEIGGKVIVQHTLFSPSPLVAGDTVEIEYDFGQELRYEKTTIGKDGDGTLESRYGRGYTPFDPANPGSSAFGSGLDFRETDERVIQTYKFEKTAKRQVEIKIKSLDPRATGGDTPYFIFNFATGRILYFQNAGIGGWKSTQFNDPSNSMGNVLRTWREIVKFQPDIVFYESTPNDDWVVGGYKVYTVNNGLSLAQLQEIRTLPNKRIVYNSGTADYTYEKWAGKIEAIDEYGLTLSSDTLIQSAPEVGDSIIVGTWYSDNKQYIERRVRAYDDTIKRVDFDFPLTDKDHVYPSLQYFVGKEVQIRDLSAYASPTLQLLEKIRSYGNKPLLGLVPNPAPNMSSRDLAAYRPLLNYLADFEDGADFYVDLANVYDWQYSQPRNSQVTVDASALVSYPDGTKRLDLTGFPKANNYMNFHVEVNGIDVTNKDAVVQTGYARGVDRTLTGAALNDTAKRGKQVLGNFYPTLVFLQNAPTSGDIVVKCSTHLWSGDSCHMNNYSKQLYAIDYATHIKE